MALPTLPDKTIARIAELRRQGMSMRDIGQLLSISSSTVAKYAKKYIPQGGMAGEPPPGQPINQLIDKLDVDGTVELLKLDRPATCEELMALCKLDRTKWIPQYFKPNTWQGYYKLKDAKGNFTHQKVQLIQSKATFKRVITEELENAILSFVRKYVKAIPKPKLKPARDNGGDGYMVAWGLWDAHIGLYAWNEEVGEDYDLMMGANRINNSIDDMVSEISSYKINKILMPIGNDFMHFDSVRHTTAFGEHFLDTDTRYAKVYQTGLLCLAYMVERALEICDDIELIYVPGNHDMTSAFTLTVALAQRFMNDPRVSVDLKMNPRKWRMYGGTLLGFDHGQEAKPNQLAMTFATEAKDVWSDSTYREIQIGHKHQKWEKMYEGVIPTNGVLIRRNPSLCNVDAWHHKKALIGEPVKSVEAWRYDKTGYRGSHVAWARDDKE